MATDARIGSQLAGYRIETQIGRGGMGVVYRAEQLRLGRKVALKLLAPELAENQGFRARFEHESRLAAALDHPNIVPLFEAGEAEGLLFISMRYVEGTDLRALLLSQGRLEPDRALAIAGQVAGALDAAHARGLVHRDVKPGNILISPGAGGAEALEHCYLTDFGLTKDTSSPVELTATGTFVGTIDYIAPEQIEGAKPDGRGDQYALACVLFECLTGHPPFLRDEEIVVMWAHLQDEPPAVTASRPELPAAIDAVISRAMAKSPKERFATCTAMVAAARDALVPRAVVPPAAVTREHGAPQAFAGATRVGAANVPPPAAPPLAVPVAAAAPAPARAAPTVGPPRPVAAARRTPLIAIAVGLVVAAAVGGVLAGQGGADKTTAPTGQAASAGALTLRHPASWRPGGSADVVPGLKLSDPIALRSGDARFVAGRIANPGPGLLPAAVKPPNATDAVTLGASTLALRQMGVPVGKGVLATVFVVPTDRGVHALACVGALGSDCEAVAATLRVRGATALDVRPSTAYATRLSNLLGLRGRRDALDRRKLARAGTSRTQALAADAARRRQARFASLARGLRPPQVARRANGAVAVAIGGIGRGYKRVAAAARAHDGAGYQAAAAALRLWHTRLGSAVDALKLLGYQVQEEG